MTLRERIQTDFAGAIREMATVPAAPADVAFAANRLKKLGDAAGLRSVRTYIARSVTVEPFLPFLLVHCAAVGLRLDLHVGTYGGFIDDLTNPDGGLAAFDPELVLLFLDKEDIVSGHMSGMLDAFRRHSGARLVVQGLVLPDVTAQGDILDANSPVNEQAAVAAINQDMMSACRRIGSAVYFDQDRIAARYGRGSWRDQRLFLSARVGVAAGHFDAYAKALARSIRTLFFPPRKVLCTDLDDTLWGGILGEDGVHGIRTGAGFPGNCYRAYQQHLKGLAQRGILLAIASKNNPADVDEAFRERAADLALSLDDFVAVKVGWNDKAESLRAMAAELSLGLESFVFVDDSPAECAAIRHHLPEVLVLQAAREEPWTLVDRLSALGAFDALTVTGDDRARTQAYQAQAKRSELERSAGSREDFLQALGIVCTMEDGMGAALPRTVQLIHKTNQFHLTTRRHSEAEVERLAAEPGSQVVTVRVRDCFGDAGVVGVAICRQRGDAAWLDTFLLSCRVIGRGIESALLAHVAAEARRRGASRLIGEYIATGKNQIAADFYTRHGFAELREGTLYELALGGSLPASPAWITMEEHVRAANA